MALGGRRSPRSDQEIIDESERQAKDWADWLEQHLATGINWVIAGKTGRVTSRRHKGASCSIEAASRYVVITCYNLNCAVRIAKYLQQKGFRLDSENQTSDSYNIFVKPH